MASVRSLKLDISPKELEAFARIKQAILSGDTETAQKEFAYYSRTEKALGMIQAGIDSAKLWIKSAIDG